MMKPAVDHQGRIWFGEMDHNCLAVFDPRTQEFRQMSAPEGASGIMGLVVAADDTVWFAEQYANYVGHYIPTTGKYQTYALPTLTRPDPANPRKTLSLPSAPNDLALDAHGNVWFTELNADALGRIDIQTGQVRHFSLSAISKGGQALTPYGVAVDPQGMVWFTSTSTSDIGRLDPATGSLRSFATAGLPSGITLMEIAADARGVIWATSFVSGLLLRFDPRDASSTPYYAPPGAGGLYGLAVTAAGDVWVAVTEANAIARLDVPGRRFEYYPIPTKDSLPLGVAVGKDGTLWFAEGRSDKLGMLDPASRSQGKER
jgi:streptogramin lyase